MDQYLLKHFFDAILITGGIKSEGDPVSPLKAHGLEGSSVPQVRVAHSRCGQGWRLTDLTEETEC